MIRNGTLEAADLFCGGGGTSTGLRSACERLGYKLSLLAINHWPDAVATHERNHREARHLCESLDSVDPRQVVPRGHLDMLLASPSCASHSRALGAMPRSDQLRATAWHVLRWADALRPEYIFLENVPDFLAWSPLGRNGQPLKRDKGQTFQTWVNVLREGLK